MAEVSRGAAGEVLAARFLREKGYTLLTANYRCRQGEVDIIAADASYIVFVEVKTRQQGALYAPREAVDAAKQHRIIATAMLRLLRFVFQEFSKRGKEISVCGEMAGNPETAQLLVGLGARKLSMSSGNIAGVKAKLAECTLQELTTLAEKKL